MEKTIFELSKSGRVGFFFDTYDLEAYDVDQVPSHLARQVEPRLPEVSENHVVRHYTRLSTHNYGVDTGMYPLGSCTMKYNPKINEVVANLQDFFTFSSTVG